jgi:hypothetical protein
MQSKDGGWHFSIVFYNFYRGYYDLAASVGATVSALFTAKVDPKSYPDQLRCGVSYFEVSAIWVINSGLFLF